MHLLTRFKVVDRLIIYTLLLGIMDILRPIRPVITTKPRSWVDGLTCPDCGAIDNYSGFGKSRHGKQRYQCNVCDRRFTGGRSGRPKVAD